MHCGARAAGRRRLEKIPGRNRIGLVALNGLAPGGRVVATPVRDLSPSSPMSICRKCRQRCESCQPIRPSSASRRNGDRSPARADARRHESSPDKLQKPLAYREPVFHSSSTQSNSRVLNSQVGRHHSRSTERVLGLPNGSRASTTGRFTPERRGRGDRLRQRSVVLAQHRPTRASLALDALSLPRAANS
jgi:hypothetical protein